MSKLHELIKNLNENISDEIKIKIIEEFVADNDESITNILKIIQLRLQKDRETIVDMNMELSRAKVYFNIIKPKLGKLNEKNYEFIKTKLTNFFNNCNHKLVAYLYEEKNKE